MADLQFPLSSSPGQRIQENGGRLINVLIERLGDGARSKVKWRRAAGIKQFADVTGRVNVRGFLDLTSKVYVALTDRLVEISSTGTVTDRGALLGELPVTFARNNKTPAPDVVCVTQENGAFTIPTSGAPTAFADASLPIPNSCGNMDGYIIFTIGDGRIFATDLNSLSVNDNSFNTAQKRPDGLYRVVVLGDRVYACGPQSIEVYYDAGTSPFPFAYETTIPKGIAGPMAIAGWEPGWVNSLIFVGEDWIVYRLDGYTSNAISTDDVVRTISRMADKTKVIVTPYMHGSHAIISVQCDDATWCYDMATQQWHERASYLDDRWRCTTSVKAFGKWLVGDAATGLIGTIEDMWPFEFDNPLVYELWSVQGSAFPYRVAVNKAAFDFSVGVGIATGTQPIQTEPQVAISWSGDGGVNFSAPVLRGLGKQGASRTPVQVNRPVLTGPQGVQCKLVISDPVDAALMSATIFNPEKRAA